MKKVEYAEIACLILGILCVIIMGICVIVYRAEIRVWHFLALLFLDCSLVIINAKNIQLSRRRRKHEAEFQDFLQGAELYIEREIEKYENAKNTVDVP